MHVTLTEAMEDFDPCLVGLGHVVPGLQGVANFARLHLDPCAQATYTSRHSRKQAHADSGRFAPTI